MASISRTINFLDESQRAKIAYTCMTDLLNIKIISGDFALASGDVAKLFVRDPTGELNSITGTIDTETNTMDFDVPTAFFPTAGESTGQVEITRSNKLLFSNQIRMNIHPYYGGE